NAAHVALSPREQWAQDLEAFSPRPRGVVPVPEVDEQGRRRKDADGRTILRASYPVWSFLDIPLEQALVFFRLDNERASSALSFADRVILMRQQLKLVVPDMPAEDFARLTPSEILAARELAMGPKVPTTVEAELRGIINGKLSLVEEDGLVALVRRAIMQEVEAALAAAVTAAKASAAAADPQTGSQGSSV